MHHFNALVLAADQERTTATATRVTSFKSRILCVQPSFIADLTRRYNPTVSGRSTAGWLRIHRNLFDSAGDKLGNGGQNTAPISKTVL